MWDVKACRACLATEGNLQKVGVASKRIYAAVTGLEIKPGDGYPTYFCQECRSHIRRCLQFRRKTRRAFYALKEIIAVKERITYNDILEVDRVKTNLVSTYAPYVTNAKIFDLVSPEIEGIKQDEIVQNTVSKNESSIPNESKIQERITEIKDFKLKMFYDKNNKDCQYKIEIQSQLTPDLNSANNVNYNLKTYTSQNFCNQSVTLVDIKPANYEEIERELEEKERKRQKKESERTRKEMERAESDRKSVKCEFEEETREREIQKCLNEFQDNYDDRDFADEQEIDLEDVFKGLEEKQDSEIESLPDLPPKAPSPKRKKPNLKKLQVQTRMKTINYSKHATLLSKAMCNSRIRLLTIEEQKEKFNAKLQTPDFVRAPFKCAICLCTSFRSLEDLVIHLETYKSQSKKHICAICKRRYETEAQLTAHSAKMHWYEYVCNTCGKKCDTYYDIVYCFESHLKHGKMILNNAFIRLPLCNEAMYHTMDKYTGLKETIVKCTQCNIGFQKIKELTAHLSLHLSPQNATQQKQMFECDICHLMFTKRNKLSTHMKQWHLYSYTCNSCSDSFMNWQQVVYHMKHNICKVDKASKHMTCRFCNKVVKVKTYGGYKHMYLYHFTQHFNVHCNLCGESYESNFNLYRHQIAKHGYARINHHELGDPRYHCAHCKFFFADDKAFQEHVVRYGHDEVKDIPNGCTMCRQVFENVEQQRDHICKQPYGSRYKALYPKTCCYCDVQLSCHLEYSTHMHTVHRELTYMPLSGYDLCERCGKTVYKRGMESHIKLHHDTTVKSVSCRYCPDMFNNHTSAVSHMLTNHTHKPYLCAVCPLRFKHRCEARDHILKVHTPVMLYYCSTCDRRFSHLDYLNDHSVKIHGTNIKGRSVYLPRRKARRIVVYPHMKIDCTLIDKEYLEKAEIEICDYMDENDKKLDNYLEYVVFNNAGETIVKAKKKKPYKYKKQKKTTNIIDNRNIMYVKNIKIATGDNVPVTSRVNELTSICNDGSCDPQNTVEARQIEKALIEDVSQEDIDADDGVNDESMVEYINEDESIVDDVNEVLIENVNEETIGGHQEGVGGDIMEVDMLDDLYENHDVIDVAGCEYVMAGGTLYKIIRE